MHVEKRNTYRLLVGMPKGKGPLGGQSHRCKGNIKMDLTETGWGRMEWNNLAQDTDQWQDCVNKVLSL
jgi:hypothetical protein